jgi:integrase
MAIADLVAFLAYSGLRIGEALPLQWQAVNLGEGLVNVQREKKGCNPWVAITPELESLLGEMQTRPVSHYLFASPHGPAKPRDASAVRHRLTAVCKKLKLKHCTPHGLRSCFVTSARQSGLTDAEIAALIGDKSGPALIATTYGDLRPDHLLAQARRIRHTVAGNGDEVQTETSHKASHTLPQDNDAIHHDSRREQVA